MNSKKSASALFFVLVFSLKVTKKGKIHLNRQKVTILFAYMIKNNYLCSEFQINRQIQCL